MGYFPFYSLKSSLPFLFSATFSFKEGYSPKTEFSQETEQRQYDTDNKKDGLFTAFL